MFLQVLNSCRVWPKFLGDVCVCLILFWWFFLMMLLLLCIIFVVVVFNLSRVTFWCQGRLWLCVVEIRPSRVRSLIMILWLLMCSCVDSCCCYCCWCCCCCFAIFVGDFCPLLLWWCWSILMMMLRWLKLWYCGMLLMNWLCGKVVSKKVWWKES